jgi:hypothetical protein
MPTLSLGADSGRRRGVAAGAGRGAASFRVKVRSPIATISLVIPAGLPDAQTLILVEKPRNGGITTEEILPVRFSQLESPEAA